MDYHLLGIGLIFVIGGGALTTWHLSHILNKGHSGLGVSYRIFMALLGGLCISIGANLIANDIHDTFDE